MAVKGKVINNSNTKQSIRFIHTAKETDGQLLEMESVYLAHSKEPAGHYHPLQEEDFKVLEGELTVKINDQVHLLKAGDTLNIPAGVHHAMWNDSNLVTVVNWQVRPAMDTEYLLETIFGLAAAGKTNKSGMPGILQVGITLRKFRNVFRLSKPGYGVQRVVFGILGKVARVMGKKAVYEEYLD